MNRPQVRLISGFAAVLLFTGNFLGAAGINPERGRNGMVVAGHPEAATIGLSVLESGGNAMDAAVATSFALGVAEPYGSGIGGKCVILYYDAESRKTWYIDGMDAAGAELDVARLQEASSHERAEGVLGIGIPGQVAAMELGHRKWGSKAWKELLYLSAALAEEGSLVVPGMPIFFERRLERIRSNRQAERIYLPDGKLPVPGQRLPNPELAQTIRRIAESGKAGFYEGAVAEAIVAEIQKGGGSLTLEDFRTYEAYLMEPLEIDWNGSRIITSPPPVKGGATVLLVMKMLMDHEWSGDSLRKAVNLDAFCNAFREVYPLIEATMGDDPEATSNWEKLLAERKAVEEVAFAEPELLLEMAHAAPAEAIDECTTHFVVADKHGNVASVTQSLSHHFGSGVIAPGTGVLLNNSLKNFSFWDVPDANAPGPGKRPTSTIAPAIVARDGHSLLAIGLPGGQRIPTTLAHVLLDHLVFGTDMGSAISATRIHLLRSWPDDPDSTTIQLETALPGGEMAALKALGWEIEFPDDSEYFGGVTAIELSENGWLTGWADSRRTNFAAGF